MAPFTGETPEEAGTGYLLFNCVLAAVLAAAISQSVDLALSGPSLAGVFLGSMEFIFRALFQSVLAVVAAGTWVLVMAVPARAVAGIPRQQVVAAIAGSSGLFVVGAVLRIQTVDVYVPLPLDLAGTAVFLYAVLVQAVLLRLYGRRDAREVAMVMAVPAAVAVTLAVTGVPEMSLFRLIGDLWMRMG